MDGLASSQYYEYQSLPPQSIRILSVDADPHPLCPESISCSLKVVKTTEEYHCLSYTWGDPFGHPMVPIEKAVARHVICNGKLIDVTANLFDALSTLRYRIPTELKQIWIDAICINQKDIAERSSQVAQMNTIFSSAVSVIAWLGPDDKHTSRLLETVGALSSCDIRPFERRDYFHDSEEASIEMSRLPPLDPIASSLMFRRAWFCRVWIIQEVVLARSIRMFIGNAELSWDDLGRLFTETYTAMLANGRGFVSPNWGDHTKDFEEKNRVTGYKIKDDGGFQAAYEVGHSSGFDIGYKIGRLLSNVAVLSDLRETYLGNGFLPVSHYIHQIIHTNRGRFFCTDPRDAIYGLNGLCKNNSIIPLSYEKLVGQIFREFTAVLILTNKNVSILSQVEDIGTRQLINLPSWVPDYSIERKGPVLNDFKAGVSIQGQQDPVLDSGLRTLCISALFVDVISLTAWNPEGHLTSAADIHGLLRFLTGFSYPYSAKGDQFKAFEETLRVVTNRFPLLEKLAEVVAGMITLYSFPADSFKKIIIDFKENDQRGAVPSWEKIQSLVNSLQECIKPSQQWWEVDVDHPVISATKDVLPYQFDSTMFRTKQNHIGIGHLSLKEGDEMWICPQAQTPFILRRQDNGQYWFLGEAYIYGLMFGELVESDVQRLERIRIE